MTTLGGFDSWATTLTGVLSAAGIDAFLGNLETLYRNNDEEADEWEAFLTALEAHYHDREILVAKLADDVFSGMGELKETLPSKLAIHLDRCTDSPSNGFRSALGKALASKEGTRFGVAELHLELVDIESRGNRRRWRVIVETPAALQTSPSSHDDGEDDEFQGLC